MHLQEGVRGSEQRLAVRLPAHTKKEKQTQTRVWLRGRPLPAQHMVSGSGLGYSSLQQGPRPAGLRKAQAAGECTGSGPKDEASEGSRSPEADRALQGGDWREPAWLWGLTRAILNCIHAGGRHHPVCHTAQHRAHSPHWYQQAHLQIGNSARCPSIAAQSADVLC